MNKWQSKRHVDIIAEYHCYVLQGTRGYSASVPVCRAMQQLGLLERSVSHKDLRQHIDSLYQLMKTFIPKASHNHIVQVIINIATFSIPYDCTYGMENEQACVVIVVG